MARRDHVLFYLDEDKQFRLSCDDLQWIIERGNPRSRRPGRDSGYRGFRFICADKRYLLRDLREQRVRVCPAGRLLVEALPNSFPEFHQWQRVLGMRRIPNWLRSRAIAIRDCRRAQGRSVVDARRDAWSGDALRIAVPGNLLGPIARKRGGRLDAGF